MSHSTTVSKRSNKLQSPKSAKTLVFLLGVIFPLMSYSQEDLSVFSYWKLHDQQPHQLYSHLFKIADQQLRIRSSAVTKLKTAKEWENRRAAVQQNLKVAMGAFPEKTPLNSVITGVSERDGIRVEKLYFESRPGYYVTAAFFLPSNSSNKLPAIIYCSGHSENGFRAEAYQRVILNYVKKGFAVLAFDPIGQGERRQYFQADGKPRFGPTSDHSYSGSPSFISGIAPANYFIWDGIRAVDYLVGRKEVDPSRIGITGRSGGGTQSAFIAAMDDRILAAAPENYITSFDKLLRSKGPQDAEQNPFHAIGLGLDLADLLEVRAPKPTLLVTTTEDMFSIQGARDVFNEVRKAYQALGKEGNVQKVEDEGGHTSTQKNREASYAFFRKFLVNPGDTSDEEVSFFTEQELYATATGNVFSALGSQTMFSLSKTVTANQIANNPEKGKPVAFRDLQKKVARLSGYANPGLPTEIVFSGKVKRAGYTIEKYLVERAGRHLIPVLWMKPEKGINKAVLVLSEQGKSAEAKTGGDAEKLVLAGYDVIIPDLSGFGELANAYLKGGDAVIDGVPLNLWYMGMLVKKSLVAARVEEVKLLLDFIKTERPSSSLSAVGIGILTSEVLHASVLLGGFDRVALVNPLVSYQSITEQENYRSKFMLSAVAGALPHYDLPDLGAALLPKPVLMLGVVDAAGEPTDENHVRSLYDQKNAGNGLKIGSLPVGASYYEALSKWLTN